MNTHKSLPAVVKIFHFSARRLQAEFASVNQLKYPRNREKSAGRPSDNPAENSISNPVPPAVAT